MTPAELRNRRIGLGLTQLELAGALGVARNTVARWERGELAMASTEMIQLALSSLDGSRREPPSIASLMPAYGADLPRQLTSFVGREEELGEVERLMETSRLTTLTGAGGVGKTRLALQVVGEGQRNHVDGPVVIELAPLASPALVPLALAAALRLGQQAQRPDLEVLANVIGTRRLLLVLDNCEHLLLACAELVDGLLRRCPAVRFLVTSREPLGIGGETVWRVPSLSVPAAREHYTLEHMSQSESVQLFGEQARAASRSVVVTDRNASAVARLCRRLDRIPLALELAAARVPVLSVEQLADRVDDALRLLVAGSRVAPPRQQTLRATLEWSYRLLSESEQMLFRRLSVFAGGWTLDAAETICAGAGIARDEELELLAHLVDKSLVLSDVRDDGANRYRLLETVRQLGVERVAGAGETEWLRDRHLGRFLSEAEQACSRASDRDRWFPWFYQELGNLRCALDWAAERRIAGEGLRLGAALHPFFAIGTFAGEGRARLEAFLALPDASAHAQPRARCLIALGNLIRISGGDLHGARSCAEQGLALARQVSGAGGQYQALQVVGVIVGVQGDVEAAASIFGECIALARDHGQSWDWELGLATGRLGWIRRLQGDEVGARQLLEESIGMLRTAGDRLFLAANLAYLADINLRQGLCDEARGYARESLELSAALGSWPNLTRALDAFIDLAAADDQLDRVVVLAGAVWAMRQHGGRNVAMNVARPEVVESARQKLGAARAALAWDTGRSMAVAEAVAFCLCETVADAAVVAHRSTIQPRSPILTDRELEVLRFVAHGKSNREIAAALVLSTRTVERHIENLYAKIGANRRVDATAYALRQRLV